MNFFLQEPTPERSVAETLRLVADSVLYRQSIERGFGMCHALYYADKMLLITPTERRRAEGEVQRYIDHLSGYYEFSYMRDALCHAGLSHDNKALIDLYSDWDNKPRIG
jgi:hypothetical protein